MRSTAPVPIATRGPTGPHAPQLHLRSETHRPPACLPGSPPADAEGEVPKVSSSRVLAANDGSWYLPGALGQVARGYDA